MGAFVWLLEEAVKAIHHRQISEHGGGESFKLLAHFQRIPGLVFLNLKSQELVNCLQSFGSVCRDTNPRTLLRVFELVPDIVF